MKDVDQLSREYAGDVERLHRIADFVTALNSIEYAYSRLQRLEIEMTMEFFLEVEALTTSLVVAYGRIFTSAEGTTKLDARVIPDELKEIHEEVMGLRHKRYAHHGAHPSRASLIELKCDDSDIVVILRMNLGFWVGAAPHWAPLILWLRKYIYEQFEGRLQHISGKSGMTWRMESGPQPDWALDG